jgi:hypothetical protein
MKLHAQSVHRLEIGHRKEAVSAVRAIARWSVMAWYPLPRILEGVFSRG